MACDIVSGSALDADSYITGRQRGHVIIYHDNCYPRRAIGPASFLWMPSLADCPVARQRLNLGHDSSKLWLWTQPACYEEFMQALNDVFKITADDSSDIKHYQTESTSCESSSEAVHFTSLLDDLAHFRLIGPEATALVRRVVQQAATTDGGATSLGVETEWWTLYSDDKPGTTRHVTFSLSAADGDEWADHRVISVTARHPHLKSTWPVFVDVKSDGK